MQHSDAVRPSLRVLTICLVATTVLLFSQIARGEIFLDPDPIWTSTASGLVATGGAWADIDGDGWLDMVVANGNDMGRQRVMIYHNQGDGTFNTQPTWSSDDVDYHGHLDIGDINGDGLPDLAVAVYLGPDRFGDPGTAKVYLNDGNGGFSSTPDWTPAERFFSFSLALGDADGDGDLDLACACGEDYENYPERQRIFYNVNGTLETMPSWVSDEVDYALDLFWGDTDQDGDMDLVFCGTSSPMRLYENHQTTGGGMGTTAVWENTDLPQYGNTCTLGDWDGDDFPEIAVADNDQLGGQGLFKVYGNNDGIFTNTPSWVSIDGGYGSHASWIDIDSDGDLDLTTGRWWGAARIYENNGGDLTLSPAWSSNTNSVVENIFWGDVDNDGVHFGGLTTATGDGVRTFFKLGVTPVHAINQVSVGGVELDTNDYVAHPFNAWISIATPPADGASVLIYYDYSLDIDMGMTNWDSNVGNYLFENLAPTADVENLPITSISMQAYPNPMKRRVWFRIENEIINQARLDIVDAGGRVVRQLHDGAVDSGMNIWEWDRRNDRGDSVGSGVYFARFETREQSWTTRVTVLQ